MNNPELLKTIKDLYRQYVLKSDNPAWLKQKPEFFEYHPDVALKETRQLKNAIISGAANHFEKVLDIGSGKGILCIAFSDIAKEVIGLEPDKDIRELAELTKEYFGKNNVKFIDGIAQKMPFENETFDLVTSTSTLEHIDGTQNVIKEVFRVLKPNGYFYLNTPNYLWFREPHYMLPMLPLMPKIILKILARLTNRNPEYINHIQYLTPRHLIKLIKKEMFIIKNISEINLQKKIGKLSYIFIKSGLYPHITIIAQKIIKN